MKQTPSTSIRFYVSARNRAVLTRRARRYAREHHCGYRKALDVIARQQHFDNWKQISDAVSDWERLEHLLAHGCVVAYDAKDVDGSDLAADGLVEDWELEIVCDEILFEHGRNQIDEMDSARRTFRETESDETAREHHDAERFELRFFYLDTETVPLPETIQAAAKILEPLAFFPPMHVWLHGVHHTTAFLDAWSENTPPYQ